ncbi:hypothetical protein MNEG_3407 [Monoraphidium neglectum]|uniref:AP2/ERF domain-containing protein n=1 Tax=Monoraphidium neglectum TaxID=145388 RepID=A0A0D2MPD3_9CHLO|nr:hypothetical protein MNEG_3407 [Monoraphidium neglectum]KIZ04545.1 hypothetical protein MNEG_3407 [Monoraphidium neglectum]|eukprot:XP_013903564.1 hypothetical protein MNEG_3407 [Monoraphidium neglectum]
MAEPAPKRGPGQAEAERTTKRPKVDESPAAPTSTTAALASPLPDSSRTSAHENGAAAPPAPGAGALPQSPQLPSPLQSPPQERISMEEDFQGEEALGVARPDALGTVGAAAADDTAGAPAAAPPSAIAAAAAEDTHQGGAAAVGEGPSLGAEAAAGGASGDASGVALDGSEGGGSDEGSPPQGFKEEFEASEDEKGEQEAAARALATGGESAAAEGDAPAVEDQPPAAAPLGPHDWLPPPPNVPLSPALMQSTATTALQRLLGASAAVRSAPPSTVTAGLPPAHPGARALVLPPGLKQQLTAVAASPTAPPAPAAAAGAVAAITAAAAAAPPGADPSAPPGRVAARQLRGSKAGAPSAVQRIQRRKNASPSTSSYKGVTRHRRTGRWEAHIWDGASPAAGSDGVAAKPGGRGKQLYLGSYDTELDAARCAWGSAPPGVDAV